MEAQAAEFYAAYKRATADDKEQDHNDFGTIPVAVAVVGKC